MVPGQGEASVYTPLEIKQAAVLHAVEPAKTGEHLTGYKKQVAEKMGQQLSAEQGRKALSSLATGFEYGGDAEHITDDMVFTEIDASTGKRKARASTTEDARVQSLKAVVDRLDAFLLDPSVFSMNPAGTQKDFAPILNATVTALSRDPQVLALFQDSSGRVKPDMVKQLLQSKEGSALLAAKLNGIFQKTGEARTIIMQNDEAIRQKEGDRKVKEVQLQQALTEQTDISGAQVKLNNFQTTADREYPPGSGTQVTGEQMLQQIDTKLKGTGDPGIDGFRSNLETYDRVVAKQRSGIPLDPTDQDVLKNYPGYIAKAKADSKYGADCITMEKLHIERRNLLDLATKANDATYVNNLNNKITQLQDELLKLQIAVEDLVFTRTQLAKSFETSLNGVVTETTAELIDKHIADFFTAYPQYEKEARTAIEQQARDKLQQYMNSRYFEHVDKKIFGIKVGENDRFNKDQVKKDITLLFKTGAPVPDNLIEQWIDDAHLTANEKSSLLDNPDFLKTQRGELVGKLLVSSALSGQKLSESQITMMATTEWGAPALEHMLKKAPEVNALLERVCGAGYGTKDVLSKVGAGKLIMLLLAALGLVAKGFSF